jgi:hypothetical protein
MRDHKRPFFPEKPPPGSQLDRRVVKGVHHSGVAVLGQLPHGGLNVLAPASRAAERTPERGSGRKIRQGGAWGNEKTHTMTAIGQSLGQVEGLARAAAGIGGGGIQDNIHSHR